MKRMGMITTETHLIREAMDAAQSGQRYKNQLPQGTWFHPDYYAIYEKAYFDEKEKVLKKGV